MMILPRKVFAGVLLSRKSLRNLTATVSQSSVACKNHYDIVIVGGGMVGGTLANALGEKVEIFRKNSILHNSILPGHEKVLAEKSILLLEGAPPFKGFPVNGEFSNRVSTLNNGTLGLLQSIGVWDRISSVRANPVYKMQVCCTRYTN